MEVIFDLDDTLYDLMSSFRKTHEDLYACKTDMACEQLFLASRRYSDEAFYQWSQGLITKEEEFAYRIRKTYEDAGIFMSDEDIHEFEQRYRAYQKKIQLMDGFEEVLEVLRQKNISVSILSNGKHKSQWEKIDSLGLTRWFQPERIFISEDLSAPKPDPRPFREVEMILELYPEEIWYVGDTFGVDMVGANAVGWHSIWYNHRKRTAPDYPVPDYEVTTAAELAQLFREI